MKQTNDAIIWILFGTRWCAYPETANINRNRLVNHSGNYIPGNNHTWIGTGLSGFILYVIPDKRCTVGIGIDV